MAGYHCQLMLDLFCNGKISGLVFNRWKAGHLYPTHVYLFLISHLRAATVIDIAFILVVLFLSDIRSHSIFRIFV